jgi:hypothetical protein
MTQQLHLTQLNMSKTKFGNPSENWQQLQSLVEVKKSLWIGFLKDMMHQKIYFV